MKRNPELKNPDDNMENVSHKVKMLENVIVNLANKVSEGQKALKEEIRALKPSFVDVIKNRDRGEAVVEKRDGVQNNDNNRDRKCSKTDNARGESIEDVFYDDQGFEHQIRRGFVGNNRGNYSGHRGGHHGGGNHGGGNHGGGNHGDGNHGGGNHGGGNHDGNGNTSGNNGRGRKSTWRKGPNVLGSGERTNFAAPVDLFVYGVNKEASGDQIVSYMKESKGLEIMECARVSHDEARAQSFRIQVRCADYELALKSDTWPYRVGVRVYRHFKQHKEAEGTTGQFGQRQGVGEMEIGGQ